MEEAELAKRREKMRRFKTFRHLSDEDLNRRILHNEEKKKYKGEAKTGGEAPVEGEPRLVISAVEETIDLEWRPLFLRKVKEFLPDFLQGDLSPIMARASAEVAAVAWLRIFIGMKFHADERSHKEAVIAFSNIMATAGVNASHRKGKPKDEDILEAFNASQKNLAKGKEGRDERLREVEERMAGRPQGEAERDDGDAG